MFTKGDQLRECKQIQDHELNPIKYRHPLKTIGIFPVVGIIKQIFEETDGLWYTAWVPKTSKINRSMIDNPANYNEFGIDFKKMDHWKCPSSALAVYNQEDWMKDSNG